MSLFQFDSRFDFFFSIWLKELNMTQMIEPLFSQYDSKIWTSFLRKTQRIETFFESKNWTSFFWYDSKNWTLFFEHVSMNWTFLYDSKNWTFFFKYDSRELNLFVLDMIQENWTFLLFWIWFKEWNFCEYYSKFFIFDSKNFFKK